MNLLIFVLLVGIGADDTFVLKNVFDKAVDEHTRIGRSSRQSNSDKNGDIPMKMIIADGNSSKNISSNGHQNGISSESSPDEDEERLHQGKK
jgi:hypothetical protein